PYMLTEKPYSVEQTRKEYLSDVYTDNNTLSVLKDNGYSVNLYTQAYYAYNTANELPDYVSNVSVAKQFETTNPMKLMGCMIGTAGFRCLPLFFKDWLFGIESATFNECVTSVGDNGQLEYASDNDVVYKKAAAATFETNGEKNFSFIHVMGCHTLMFDYISLPVTSLQKSNITSVVEESLDIVNEYINVLKEKNLYKDATIIITGDHPNPINNLGAPAGAKLTALFFKPSGSDATPIVQSNAPVAHENIWPAIMKSENITRSNERAGLFDIAENDVNHERKYIWHTYVSNQCDEYVYSIKGSGKNFDNWTLVETNHVDRFLMA
ncbi:MAG: hypothetical protein K2N47_00475, partial [Clostridia bacterium]|nr:hypothetical protein [Clostridia bacterium]